MRAADFEEGRIVAEKVEWWGTSDRIVWRNRIDRRIVRMEAAYELKVSARSESLVPRHAHRIVDNLILLL